MSLNPKQSRFVDEYLIDLNAAQAAIRAGYSPRTAKEIGCENLTKPYIAAAIAERQKAREQRTEITQDKVLAELAKLGFSDLRRAVKWGDGIAVKDEEGETTIANGVSLVDSGDLDDDTAAAISEISQTAQGIKIKLHDKRAALVDIGRHLGMFTDKLEINASITDMMDDQLMAKALELSKKIGILPKI